MEYNVVLNSFEGPLDLLLHLIDEAKVDIYDIPINEITDQYIEYIKKMEKLDLDITSDFIMMVSSLLHIKSNMLLPKKEDEEEDPRDKLVLQLIEYRKYKEVSREFEDMSKKSYKRFNKQQEDLSYLNEEELCLDNLTLDVLYKSFKELLKERDIIDVSRVNVIRREYYPIEESIKDVKAILDKKVSGVYFMELFSDVYTRDRIISLFLAILELTKVKYLCVVQEANYKDILLKKVVSIDG